MHRRLKVLLAALTFLSGTVAIFFWLSASLATVPKPAWIYAVFTVPFLIFGGLLAWFCLRKDRIPDCLRAYSKLYYDRDGLGFVFRNTTSPGACKIFVPYQNRYERPCRAHIRLTEYKGIMDAGQRHTFDIKFICDGGAYGLASQNWAIPERLRGQMVQYVVTANVDYPEGKGLTLRFTDGVPVTSHDGQSEFVEHLLLAILGIHRIFRPSTVTLKLPRETATPDNLPAPASVANRTMSKYLDGKLVVIDKDTGEIKP